MAPSGGVATKQTGRSVRVYLTKAGRSLEHLKGFYEEVNDLLLVGFTEKEATQLFELMERVLNNAKSEDPIRSSDVDISAD